MNVAVTTCYISSNLYFQHENEQFNPSWITIFSFAKTFFKNLKPLLYRVLRLKQAALNKYSMDFEQIN